MGLNFKMNKPRNLCNGNGAISYLQTEMRFVEDFNYWFTMADFVNFVQKYKKNTQESDQILVKSTKGTKIAHNALEKIILT